MVRSRTSLCYRLSSSSLLSFFFNATATTEIYTLSLHDALPIFPSAGTVDGFYNEVVRKFGEAFKVLSHTPWKGGYADVLWVETPMAVSRNKRFYRVAESRGYVVAFEARDDVYPRVIKWCDMIASTLKIGPEIDRR